jgi:hypothetical protein
MAEHTRNLIACWRLWTFIHRTSLPKSTYSHLISYLTTAWSQIWEVEHRFEVFTAVTMQNAVYWDVTPCGSCKNRISEERMAFIIRVTRIGQLGMLAVTRNRSTLLKFVARWFTLMMEAIRSSETSVLTAATRRNIQDHCILHSPRVFENRMLRRLFGPKEEEVTGGWRKQHNEELRYFYFSSSIIRI